MTHSEAKKALARSSWADCIIANLNAHVHSRGVTWARGGKWHLQKKEIVKENTSDAHWKRLERLGAIEFRSDH